MTWLPSHTDALAAALARAYPARVVVPGDVSHDLATGLYRLLVGALPATWRAVAAPVLDGLDSLAARVSVTIPTPDVPVIVLSHAAVADATTRACTMLHEWCHVRQIAHVGRWQTGVDYLGSGELRAQREADATAAALWLRYVIDGALPETAPALADLYHLDAGDSHLVADILAAHLATIRAGCVPPIDVCVVAARWLLASPTVPDDVRARVAQVTDGR